MLKRFLRDCRANVTILFALSLIPMIGIAGLGVDYGIALSTKSKLDNAADAAALSAVVTAKAYVAANPFDPLLNVNAVLQGKDRAYRAFAVNGGRLPFSTVPTPHSPCPQRADVFAERVLPDYYHDTVRQDLRAEQFHSPRVFGRKCRRAELP